MACYHVWENRQSGDRIMPLLSPPELPCPVFARGGQQLPVWAERQGIGAWAVGAARMGDGESAHKLAGGQLPHESRIRVTRDC